MKADKMKVIALGILAIMVLSTVGFSIVSFYADKEEEQFANKEIKPCVNDSDCILICNMEPFFINCTDNMCDESECPI